MDELLTSSSPLIRFYTGQASDHYGRYIEEIWEQSAAWFEETHDYIQWLFPIPEPSRFNVLAPVLGSYERSCFHESEELQSRQGTSLEVMLGFYGLRWERDVVVARTGLNPSDHTWLESGGHNHLRITRIIRSLYLCGQQKSANAFRDAVIKIGTEQGSVSEQSKRYWRSAAVELNSEANEAS